MNHTHAHLSILTAAVKKQKKPKRARPDITRELAHNSIYKTSFLYMNVKARAKLITLFLHIKLFVIFER